MSDPETAPSRRLRVQVRAALAALATLALAGVAYIIATTAPTNDSIYPKCVAYQLTGLHCPGCGAGRAAHAALNGRLAQALAYNPFAVVLLPLLVAAGLIGVGRWVADCPPRDRYRIGSRWVLGLAIALILYTVARNVTHYPFTLLAPHEL